jgi:hypothetical protein
MKPYLHTSAHLLKAGLFCLLAGLLVLASLPALAQNPPPRAAGPLLRILESHMADGERIASDETLIFRDGLTVALRQLPDGSREVLRGHASTREMGALSQALEEHRVGTQTARCQVQGLIPSFTLNLQELDHHALISWFGRNGRRSRHMEVSPSEEVFSSRCHSAMEQLAVTVLRFNRGVLSRADEEHAFWTSLLFDLDSWMLTPETCENWGFSERTLLFRDGLVMRLVEDNGNWFLFGRAQASQETMMELNLALAQQRVGFASGACRLWFFLPFLVEERCADFDWSSTGTWYGRGTRQARLYGDVNVQQSCSADQTAIRHEVLSAILSALTNPSAISITGTLGSH